MGDHLNRLNDKDAKEFDKAFEIFCKTGVWTMGQENPLQLEQMMPDPSRSGRYPGSRDWDLEAMIPCANSKCICHAQSFGKGTCGAPSRCAIDSHGKCAGYQPKEKKKKNGKR